MARMCKIEGIEFNSVMYEANEWVLASEVAPYIKEAVKTSHNTGSPKLPSIEECYKAIPFPEDNHDQAYFVAGIAECHIFIARQLSGRA